MVIFSQSNFDGFLRDKLVPDYTVRVCLHRVNHQHDSPFSQVVG
jgi:hypothetical protein